MGLRGEQIQIHTLRERTWHAQVGGSSNLSPSTAVLITEYILSAALRNASAKETQPGAAG